MACGGTPAVTNLFLECVRGDRSRPSDPYLIAGIPLPGVLGSTEIALMLNDSEAKALAVVVRSWSLNPAEQSALLGDPSSSPPDHYQKRARDLIAIRKWLRSLIVEPRGLADYWVRSSNMAFDNRQPLQVLIDEQDAAFEKLKNHLHRFL